MSLSCLKYHFRQLSQLSQVKARSVFPDQCIYTLLHICLEITHIGPGTYTTQIPLECAIGDLGKSIQQPATPFANLTQVALQQAQANALFLELNKTAAPFLPQLSHDLGQGSVLLQPRDHYMKNLQGAQ